MNKEMTDTTTPFIHLVKITWLEGMKTGWGNGYVNLPKGHKYYGVHYDEIDVNVHGGLTFSEQEGEYWVIGFDTCHAGDTPDNCPFEMVKQEAINLLNQVL